jgi:hypothetical protein
MSDLSKDKYSGDENNEEMFDPDEVVGKNEEYFGNESSQKEELLDETKLPDEYIFKDNGPGPDDNDELNPEYKGGKRKRKTNKRRYRHTKHKRCKHKKCKYKTKRRRSKRKSRRK